MWIKSQDKKRLLEVKYFAIINTNVEAVFGDYSSTTLGKYSTEEKAMKVLDEIERFVNDLEYYKTLRHTLDNYVYQLPQDEEV